MRERVERRQARQAVRFCVAFLNLQLTQQVFRSLSLTRAAENNKDQKQEKLIEIKKKTGHKGVYKSFLPSKTRIEKRLLQFPHPADYRREKRRSKTRRIQNYFPSKLKTKTRTSKRKKSKKAPPGNLQALIKLPIIDDT
jgi:hypothetical protein